MLFRFTYPCERDKVPERVMRELLARVGADLQEGNHARSLCRGNLISRVQYRHDYEHLGYEDGRMWDEAQRSRGAELDGGRELPAGGRR
jgi:hypothetical protein